MPINTSGFQFADTNPVNTGSGYQAVTQRALAQINPASFALDLVSPFVTGIKGAQTLLAPLAEGVEKIAEYNRPENVAAREASIAKNNAETQTAPEEAKYNLERYKTETPLLGKRAALEGMRIGSEEDLLPLRTESEKTGYQVSAALNKSDMDFYNQGGGAQLLQNKIDTVKNNTETIKNESHRIENQRAEIEQDKVNKPKEYEIKSKQLDIDQQNLDIAKKMNDDLVKELNESNAPSSTQPQQPQTPQTQLNLSQPQEGGGALTQTLGGRSSRYPTADEQALAERRAASMSRITKQKIEPDVYLNQIHKAATGVSPYTKEQRESVKDLNDKFESNETVKGLEESASALSRIQSAAKGEGGLTDLQLVDLMNQIVNKPGIKVTEGNVDLIKGTVPGTVKLNPAYWGHKATNGSFLTPEIRAQFADMAKKMVGSTAQAIADGPLSSYRARAARQDIDANDIAPDFNRYLSTLNSVKPAAKAATNQNIPVIKSREELDKLPKGASFNFNGVIGTKH